MIHTISFRGKELVFNVEKGVNTNFISEVNGLQTKKLCSIGHQTNNNSEALSLRYLQLIEVGGEVVQGSTVLKPQISTIGSYEKFLSMSGDFSTLINAELNFIAEEEYSSQCIAFNPLKSFEPIQPITMDFITSDTGVTVDIIDKPEDSTLLYTIGNPESESANWLPLPTDEIPLSKGSYNFFVINQDDGYPFGFDNAFTISENLPI